MPPDKTTGFARRSILLIFSQLIRLAAQLVVIYIYARVLSIDDYGHYQSIWLYISVFSVIGLFGFPSVILSFSPSQVKTWIKENKRTVLLYSVLSLGLIGWILIMPASFSLPNRLLLCSLLFLQNVSIIAETLSIKKEKEIRVLTVNIFFTIAYVAAHLYVLQQQAFDLKQLLIYLNILFLLKFLLLINSTLQKANVVNTDSTATIGKQWLYLGLNDVVAVLFKWIDKWVILIFISLNEFAVYFNGSYEIPVFIMLAGAVGNIIVVELSKSNGVNGDLSIDLFRKASIFLSSAILPAFCFLLFFYREFFVFIFSEKYEAALPVFFTCIFVIPIRIINHTAALQVYHKNETILKGALIDLLLAIVLLGALYPVLGLTGIALAFVLSSYIQVGYYLHHTSILLQIPVIKLHPFKTLATILIISLIVIGFCYLLCKQFSALYSLGFGLFCTAALAGSLLLFFYRKRAF